MKLVDILAKGLKSWPEGLECLSQLKGTGYIINGKGFDGRAFDALQIADETLVAGAIVTRAEWQAAVDALNAPKVVEWDGESLPPVGLECEFHTTDAGDFWCRATVKFVGTHFIIVGYKHPNFGISEAGINHALIDFNFSELLRPIRTAEQVAAEERKSEILEMIDTFGTDTAIWGRDAVMEICGHLWESGYRKEKKQCGS